MTVDILAYWAECVILDAAVADQDDEECSGPLSLAHARAEYWEALADAIDGEGRLTWDLWRELGKTLPAAPQAGEYSRAACLGVAVALNAQYGRQVITWAPMARD